MGAEPGGGWPCQRTGPHKSSAERKPAEYAASPNGTGQARSAGREARGLAPNQQNNLAGSPGCGGAVLGGAGSDAAGRRSAKFMGTGSDQPPYFGRIWPSRPNSAPASFSLLDRARPVFSFSARRKRENGGCIAPAIIMAEIPPPPARASKTHPRPLAGLTSVPGPRPDAYRTQ